MHYLIDFVNTATEEQITEYLSGFNATIVKTFNRFENIYHIETSVIPPECSLVEHCVRDDENPIKLHSTVVHFDQTYGQNILTGDVIELDINNPDNWWKVYSLVDVDLNTPVNRIGRRGENATVYVLDSGINTTHPDFVGQNVTNLWSFVNDLSPANDTNGHGTAIASVISGKSCGITNATVKGVKIFEAGVATLQSHMISALDAVFDDYIQSGMNSNNNGSIVNCSWTIDRNSLIEKKIKQMIDAGMLFVCASGNNGIPIENVTPAAMLEVLTVGSYNSDFKPSNFSNYTSSTVSATANEVNHGALDGWAPGENIRVATVDGGYANIWGTSIAAGIHSAVLAFNLNWQLTEYLSIMSSFEFMASSSFGRRDLLDLSDSRYRNSVNKISSIRPNIVKEPTMQHNFFGRAPSNGSFLLNMFNVLVCEKVELLATLPGELIMCTSGRLYGIAPDISNLNVDYTLNSIPFKVTLRDGTIYEDTLEIFTYQENLNPNVLDTGDPVLNIKLQAGCSGDPCADPSCFDNCPNRDCTSQSDNSCPTKVRCVCYYG